ncbi:cyclic nucleotide-binding domain-containing protein [Povalibacter sp.]|uniref:cyclic nucleotide-binding domain-containing protein n=1 Tax=Povalibacter sp. TaxID=1962978 RepID=UPI002F3ED513
MSLPLADYFAHASNVLLLISYSVRDILWLRWFAVAAAFIVMPYYLAQPTILWPPVMWGTVFAIINLYQIARIYAERRPVVLSADEQRLYDLAFRVLRPREFLAFVMLGEWRTAQPGEVILKQGETTASISIAIEGSAQICRDGQVLGALAPGHVIGLALALTGTPSLIEGRFAERGRYMRWPALDVRAFTDSRPELRAKLQSLVNQDLALKVGRMVAREIE